MEILYIKREGTYFINLKTYLVKYNGSYDSVVGYIWRQYCTVNILEVSRFCEMINILLNHP